MVNNLLTFIPLQYLKVSERNPSTDRTVKTLQGLWVRGLWTLVLRFLVPGLFLSDLSPNLTSGSVCTSNRAVALTSVNSLFSLETEAANLRK